MTILSALREAARKATPGPREHRGHGLTGMLIEKDRGTIICDPYGPNPQDQDFFVLVSPDLILRLLDVVEAAKAYFDAVNQGYPLTPNLGAVRTALRFLEGSEEDRR